MTLDIRANTLAEVVSSQPKWQHHAPVPESSKRPCILYVEKNEVVFHRIEGALENAGYGVVGASDGWQALSFLLNNPIRLVLGGDALCGADGVELVAKMKAIKPDVPIVVCSQTLPSSMKGLDAFVSVNGPISHLLELVKGFLPGQNPRS